MKNRSFLLSALLLAGSVPGLALATDGYFSHGYGVKAQGLAGVGIALPQDGLAAATNPAGSAFLGNRADIGLTWFQPNRGAEIVGNQAGLNGSYDGNATRDFLIPEFGYVRQLSPVLATGLAVYGHGGMNTDYSNNPFRPFGASGNAGIDLSQLFISPSVAYKLNESHALGLAANFIYQRFKAEGIQPFANYSASSANFSNQGYDSSTGWGIRLGYTGKITPDLTVGATWASRSRMGTFDKYRGLFAESGGFDIPSNYGVGLAYRLVPRFTLAADLARTEYGDIKSVGDTFNGNAFGSANGTGFGWRNVTVVRVGGSFDVNDELTLRAGYNHVTQPIPSSQTLLNILAPGVVQDHLSLGATWQHGKSGEFSFAYTHAFKAKVNGNGSIPASFGGGEANLHMDENILGVAYGWKL